MYIRFTEKVSEAKKSNEILKIYHIVFRRILEIFELKLHLPYENRLIKLCHNKERLFPG